MICLVPARGNSKGLPGKNIRPLAGEPLIVHTLRAALAAKSIERVIVSTDDEEIMAVCRTVDGVEIPFTRPRELATDEAGAVDVYLHAADWLGANEGTVPAAMCVLLPTSPLRLAEDVDGAVELFHDRGAEIVVAVTNAMPVDWIQTLGDDRRMTPYMGENASIANRQSLPEYYLFNGSIFVLSIDAIRRTRSYNGPNTYGFVMPKDRSVDIDDLADFARAEALLRLRREGTV